MVSAVSFLLTLVIQANAHMFHFVGSPSTPFNLDDLAHKVSSVLPDGADFTITNLTDPSTEMSGLEEGIVLDYTYDQGLTALLREHSSNVVMRWSGSPSSASIGKYGELFSRYLEALHFMQVILISDSKQSNVQLSQFLAQTYPSIYEVLHIIPYNADVDFCLQFVGEILKPSGANLFTVVTDEVAAMNLLSAFETKKLDKEGYAYVLSSQASYYQHLTTSSTGLLSTGTLYIADSLTSLAQSLEEAEELLLQPILKQLVNQESVSEFENSLNHTFVLVNIANLIPRIVATSPEEVDLNERAISFPGNTSVIPFRTMSCIPTSVNYLFLDSTGIILPQSTIIMRGVQVAYEETNNSTSLIPNFIVNDYSLSLSGMTFNYTFTKSQVQRNLTHLGVIHISPPLGTNIMGTFSIFEELNLTMPMVSGSGISALSSSSDYPMYARAKTDNAYTALVMARMFGYFGWKSAAILYSQDQGDNQDFYHTFMNLTSTFAINITNDEATRGLSPSLTVTTAQLNASISEIMNSSVRIVIISHYYLMTILKAMYDLGVRSEYLICTWFGVSYMIVSEAEPDAYKIRTVAKGAIQVYPTPFIGEQGEKVLRYLTAWDGMNYFPNSCYYYDSAMLYMHSTDYMLQRGIDFEDPIQLMKAMRGTRFTGCCGNIQIAPDSNNRAAAQFSLLNLKYYENNDTVVVEDVMYYNPFSSTLYQQLKPIMWPDNSKVYTDNLIDNFHCPFLEKQTRNFTPGLVLGVVVSFVICVFTGISALLIWQFWWKTQHQMLKYKYEISADDVMQLIAIPLEFLQVAGAGPNSQSLNSVLAALCASIALDLTVLLNMTGGVYWTVLNGVLSGLGVYVVLCILKLTRFEKRLECLPLFSFVMLWVDLALPIFSNLLFFPIISTLSRIFLCYRSIGDNFTSSYLNNDCYEFCWQGSHIIYVVLCSTALVIYIPLGIFTKPLWQEMQPSLHIRAQPPSLMVKSFVQVLLLTLSHTLRNDYPGVHAGLYLAIVVGDIIFITCFKQFNYDR